MTQQEARQLFPVGTRVETSHPAFKDMAGVVIATVGDIPGDPEKDCIHIRRYDGQQGTGVDKSWIVSRYEIDITGLRPVANSAAKKSVQNQVPDKIDYKHLDKVILPDEVRDSIVTVLKQHEFSDKIFNKWGLSETIEYGKGMTMLFHGSPGTGKTWASQCIAKAIGRELLILDNAHLQSSSPGEMERNIEAAFKEATDKNKVLLLDECDSLLMTRDNVGMIIGSEINCLLTQIEKFEGVCILTTNRIGELDKALERRLSCIVKFPKPDTEGRVAIWKRIIPKKMPLDEDVDLFELAESYDITGGLIKNAVLGAARIACMTGEKKVKQEHFTLAVERLWKGNKSFQTESKAPRSHMATIGRDVGRNVDIAKVQTDDVDVESVI